MPKRPRSPSSDAVSVGGGARRDHAGLAPLFELDELFLRVLAFLPAADLARAQRVSRHWGRVALDPQLWKTLYLERYPHPHHFVRRRSHVSQPSRSGTSTPLRPIARLPSRAFPPQSPSPSPAPEDDERRKRRKLLDDAEGDVERETVRNDGVDWKLMMRLGTNWSNGNALYEARVPLPPSPAPTRDDADQTPPGTDAEHHLALFPSFICTSNPASPLVHVYASDSAGDTPSPPLGIVPPPPGWSSPSRPDVVAAIVADQSVLVRDAASPHAPVPARLAVLYASGGFAVVRLRVADGRLLWSRESVWNSRTRPRRRHTHVARDDDPVVLATLHFPVLVTCTRAFILSVYSVAQGEPVLLRTLRSDVSFHPAALSLFPPSEGSNSSAFRAALTYCTPVYPASWSVAVQELAIEVERGTVARREAYSVASEVDESVWPRRVYPLPGVRGRAVGIGCDGRWCVLAGDDSVIHVYALPTTRTGGITLAQTLLAPSGGVTALALQAGRCVSGGRDGRVLVWDLDAADAEDTPEDGEARVGTVAAVEVRPGGRKRPPPSPGNADANTPDTDGAASRPFPHPSAISAAARSFFLPTLPASLPAASAPPFRDQNSHSAIQSLAVDEEKIVGLIDGPAGDAMRVWRFN